MGKLMIEALNTLKKCTFTKLKGPREAPLGFDTKNFPGAWDLTIFENLPGLVKGWGGGGMVTFRID